MRTRRAPFAKRRQNHSMPDTPFMDSRGAMVTKSRRKNPDRRAGNKDTGMDEIELSNPPSWW